ncbi:GntR family transcriptional regulator [Clostridium tertium]|uniref:GntR family transcriptional regulator n=1 Tax=Clostridium TaxID=1485 RepID=UPI00115BE804|nr:MULTISPECIES: GntR family transcriptional regulator [Clostridium]MBS4958674.1 GntR family transcriptional regulator [Clostridium sp.]MDB1921632.1 GntR family transcriptional regulator [Clostridium tertium]MDB1924836.1 GntR family transcriptional regulator [Clostridium tertium]MDB1930557.1 GntR family transcriptional regulator [Clostridium tertium]MDU2157406.1 GntR family transcriptional regulator [Clostridium sp.]
MVRNTKSNTFAEILKKEIDNKIYPFGSCIPSERELSKKYALNRSTIRTAIASLVEDGYLTKVQGRGNFVTKNNNTKLQINFRGMSDLLKNVGFNPSSKIIAIDIRKAGYKLSKIFNISEDEIIFRIMRLRLGNDEPISIEDTYVPYSLIPNIDKIDFQIYSLYDIFAAHEIQLDHINQVYTSTRVRNIEARLLNLNDGDSVISVSITGYIKENIAVEYTEVLVIDSFSRFYTDSYFESGEVKTYAQIN